MYRAIKIEKQREIHVIGGAKQLTPNQLTTIAKQKGIIDFEISIGKVYSAKRPERKFKHFHYILNY